MHVFNPWHEQIMPASLSYPLLLSPHPLSSTLPPFLSSPSLRRHYIILLFFSLFFSVFYCMFSSFLSLTLPHLCYILSFASTQHGNFPSNVDSLIHFHLFFPSLLEMIIALPSTAPRNTVPIHDSFNTCFYCQYEIIP